MNEILEKIRECVIVGKINASTPFPPDMKGMPGAYDYTKEAIESGISPADIMNRGLVSAMDEVGQRFAENKIFVPQMLLSAKAMNAAMELLKPYFNSGAVRRKGTVIIGTILGDLHDIGKNLCGMMIEGAGWEVGPVCCCFARTSGCSYWNVCLVDYDNDEHGTCHSNY